MMDICEELSDITFQNPNSPCVVPGNSSSVLSELIYCTMYTLIKPAGIRIENEFAVKIGI